MLSAWGASQMRSACIIPTKDRISFVEKAVESVLAQEVVVDEIIVVDDGSTDDTANLIRRKYPFIKLVITKEAGPGRARNLGVNAASADILFFLDSDDQWHKDHTAQLLTAFSKGFHVAYGITKTIDLITGSVFHIPEPECTVEGNCLDDLVKWCHLVPSSLAVSRHAFERAGGFPEHAIGEDWLFLLELASCYRFYFSNKVITTRYLHEGSLSFNKAWQDSDLFDLVGRIEAFVTSCKGVSQESLQAVSKMKQLVRERGANWSSIQDWYMAAKQRGVF